MRIRLCLLAFALCTAPAAAQLELKVGREALSWIDVQDSLAFVISSPDSVWTWRVESGENLMANVAGRGGSILVSAQQPSFNPFGEAILTPVFLDEVTAVKIIGDGDLSTAFNPDDFGLDRQTSIYIDLGGAYSIERTRLSPRLDAEHVGSFPQTFDLGLGDRLRPVVTLMRLLTTNDVSFRRYLFFGITRPNIRAVVEWPGVLQVSGERQARYVRFQPIGDAPWELAELELYTDGTAPPGFYRSVPLLAGTGTPVWGRVRHEGGLPIEELPIVLQTRTGPDEDPLIYFITQGPQEVQVNRAVWEYADDFPGIAQGPVKSNPNWSGWETVDGNVVRSPSPNSYLQFQVRFLQPGVKLEQLVFEYFSPPSSGQMRAEISPNVVDAGAETEFAMSMQTRRLEGRSDTGYRLVEVLTSAEVAGVDSVKVDDELVLHTVRLEPGRGFKVNLWKRVIADGSFFQVFFRGKVFVDGTQFEVRTAERRSTAEVAESDTVFQYAQEADVDLQLTSSGLTVRLSAPNAPLLDDVVPARQVLTPNGDGVNDVFEIAYSLLKLTQSAPVFFEIYNLGGRLVRRGYAGEDRSGRFARVWDGRDDYGALVGPGLYLYQVQVAADNETECRTGVVNVAY